MPLRSNLSDLTYKSRRHAGHRKREINPELSGARLKATTMRSFWAATCPSQPDEGTPPVESAISRQCRAKNLLASLNDLYSFE